MNDNLFGERLKKLRESRGMYQDQLSTLLGYKDRTMISKFENGVHKAPYSTLVKLASIFNVSPNYLLGYDDVQTNYQLLLDLGFDLEDATKLTPAQIEIVNNLIRGLVASNLN